MNSANYYHPSYLSTSVYKKPLSHNSDESGCEADMADGGQEDDSGDVGGRKTISRTDSVEAPLNLKSEGSDDSSPPSPDQYPQSKDERCMPPQETKVSNSGSKLDAKTAEMVQHLLMMNGQQHDSKMAALQNYQNLQNFCSVNSLVAGLQSLSGLPTTPPLPNLGATHQGGLLNTPLNLTMVATQQLLSPQTTAMPQFVLAGGQMVQGIQGAQLLVPTSQGIVTQTILTIPVNHVTSNQVVNLALPNGQVVSTTLAQLQNMPQTHHLLSTNNSAASPAATVNTGGNLLGFNGLPPHQQQLLNAMQQQPHLVSNTMLSGNGKSPVHRTHHSYSSNGKNGTTSGATHNANNNITSSSNNNNNNSSLPNGCNNALTAISRLTANNSDITITASPAPAHLQHHNITDHFRNRERSESPISDGGCDLLDDSPNEPMISEVQSNVVDGINLDEMKEFAKAFKLRRLSLGLTQTQVGQALSVTEGPAYSQSAICSALASQVLDVASRQPNMFEKLDITPKSAQKIKPVLERWMKEAEERFKSGQNHLTEFIGMEPSKKRKRRTSFTPQALELLNVHFERNTHPSGTEITALAHQLGYEREVIRIWFCNKRQALKNTVRMMSKSGSIGGSGG